jgi:hypothetical protein
MRLILFILALVMADIDRQSFVSQKRQTLQAGQTLPVSVSGSGIIFKRADYQLFCRLDQGELFPVEAGSKILRTPGGTFKQVTLVNVANVANTVEFYAFAGNVDFILNLLTGFVPSVSLDLLGGDKDTSVDVTAFPKYFFQNAAWSYYNSAGGNTAGTMIGSGPTTISFGRAVNRVTIWLSHWQTNFSPTGIVVNASVIQFKRVGRTILQLPIGGLYNTGDGTTASIRAFPTLFSGSGNLGVYNGASTLYEAQPFAWGWQVADSPFWPSLDSTTAGTGAHSAQGNTTDMMISLAYRTAFNVYFANVVPPAYYSVACDSITVATSYTNCVHPAGGVGRINNGFLLARGEV